MSFLEVKPGNGEGVEKIFTKYSESHSILGAQELLHYVRTIKEAHILLRLASTDITEKAIRKEGLSQSVLKVLIYRHLI